MVLVKNTGTKKTFKKMLHLIKLFYVKYSNVYLFLFHWAFVTKRSACLQLMKTHIKNIFTV